MPDSDKKKSLKGWVLLLGIVLFLGYYTLEANNVVLGKGIKGIRVVEFEEQLFVFGSTIKSIRGHRGSRPTPVDYKTYFRVYTSTGWSPVNVISKSRHIVMHPGTCEFTVHDDRFLLFQFGSNNHFNVYEFKESRFVELPTAAALELANDLELDFSRRSLLLKRLKDVATSNGMTTLVSYSHYLDRMPLEGTKLFQDATICFEASEGSEALVFKCASAQPVTLFKFDVKREAIPQSEANMMLKQFRSARTNE